MQNAVPDLCARSPTFGPVRTRSAVIHPVVLTMTTTGRCPHLNVSWFITPSKYRYLRIYTMWGPLDS